MNVGATIHARIDGEVLCGAPPSAASVPPHGAQFVTCKRCLRSLHRGILSS